MSVHTYSVRAWRSVHQRLGPNGRMTISKALAFPHPREAGARATISWPMGQIADYALEVGVGLAPIFIREFTDRYEIAMAGIDLTGRAIALLEANPKAALCTGGALLGAAVATALARKADAAVAGAVLGALTVLLLNTYLEQRELSRTTCPS